MKKRLIYRLFPKMNRPIGREELTEITLDNIEKTKLKVAELRGGLLTAYAEDREHDIPYFEGILGTTKLGLGEYQANLKALNNPEVKGRFSYERMRRRYRKQNMLNQPLDLVIEHAKRAHLQRKEEAEKWLDDRFSAHQQMERFLEGKNYEGCPIGNFSVVEENYQKTKANSSG